MPQKRAAVKPENSSGDEIPRLNMRSRRSGSDLRSSACGRFSGLAPENSSGDEIPRLNMKSRRSGSDLRSSACGRFSGSDGGLQPPDSSTATAATEVAAVGRGRAGRPSARTRSGRRPRSRASGGEMKIERSARISVISVLFSGRAGASGRKLKRTAPRHIDAAGLAGRPRSW